MCRSCLFGSFYFKLWQTFDGSNPSSSINFDNNQLIVDARNYFEKSNLKQIRLSKQSLQSDPAPFDHLAKNIDWSKAGVLDMKIGKIVTVPTRTDLFVSSTIGSHRINLSDWTRTFIWTDKNNAKHINVVSYVPDADYLDDINSKKRFTGVITVRDWAGNFIRAFKYEKNGVKKMLGSPSYESLNAKKISQSYKTADVNCLSVTKSGIGYDADGMYVWIGVAEVYCSSNGTGGGSSGGGGNYPDEEMPTWDDGAPQDMAPTEPAYVENKDSLKKKAPCLVKLVLNKLATDKNYTALTYAFGSPVRPSLNWDITDNMPWGPTNYQLGEEGIDSTSSSALTRSIRLNQKMINNSSQLLIATGVIHETLHSYASASIIRAESNFMNHREEYSNPWAAIDCYWGVQATQYYANPNYNNHYQMVSDFFCYSLNILMNFDGGQHTEKQCVMAMLYGLTTVDANSPADQKTALEKLFKGWKTAYEITDSELNEFWKSNLNAPAGERLPTSGCSDVQ